MNGRERTLAAIRHELPDRLPVDYICVENAGAVTQAAGLAPNADVDAFLGRDGRIVAAGEYTGELPRRAAGQPLSMWGTEDGNDYGTAHHYPLAAADTVTAVERHAWPDGRRFADFSRQREAALHWDRQYAVRGPYWASAPLFCTMCNLMGMEEAMMKMASEPAVAEACLDQVMRFSLTYAERFLNGCGDALDILYLADDFASQRGLLMRPQQWRTLLKPRYARLFQLGKRRGLPIWFHSCGDITAVLPDLIDIGLDVWETVQLHALPMPAAELKRRFGRHVTFFGGINTQRLPFATPAAVRAEVVEVCRALGAGGGFICGPDHHIKPDVPPANALALFEAARGFRQAGITWD